MSLASISQNISAGVPVDIQWSSDGEPVNLTLTPHGSGDYALLAESTIISNVLGDSYVWKPNGSLVLGGFYLIGLLEKGKGPSYSHYLVCTEYSTTVKLFIGPRPASQSITSQPSASQSSASQSPNLYNSPARQNTGTTAGVAVGAAIFVILILTSVILCWRHRHRSPKKSATELPGYRTNDEIKSDAHTTIWVPELGQEGAVHGPHELPVTSTTMNETARAGELSAAEGRGSEIAELG